VSSPSLTFGHCSSSCTTPYAHLLPRVSLPTFLYASAHTQTAGAGIPATLQHLPTCRQTTFLLQGTRRCTSRGGRAPALAPEQAPGGPLPTSPPGTYACRPPFRRNINRRAYRRKRAGPHHSTLPTFMDSRHTSPPPPPLRRGLPRYHLPRAIACLLLGGRRRWSAAPQLTLLLAHSSGLRTAFAQRHFHERLRVPQALLSGWATGVRLVGDTAERAGGDRGWWRAAADAWTCLWRGAALPRLSSAAFPTKATHGQTFGHAPQAIHPAGWQHGPRGSWFSLRRYSRRATHPSRTPHPTPPTPTPPPPLLRRTLPRTLHTHAHCAFGDTSCPSPTRHCRGMQACPHRKTPLLQLPF